MKTQNGWIFDSKTNELIINDPSLISKIDEIKEQLSGVEIKGEFHWLESKTFKDIEELTNFAKLVNLEVEEDGFETILTKEIDGWVEVTTLNPKSLNFSKVRYINY